MGRRGAVWVVAAALMLPCRAQAAPPAETKPPRDPVVRNLTITGGVLTVLGAAGLGLGFGGFGMARHASRRLDALSGPSATGFPVGDWSCRNASARDCPRIQWDNMRLGNRLGTTGVLTGSVFAVGGMVLLIVAAQLRAERAAEPSDDSSNGVGTPITRVTPMLGPRGAGLSVELRF